MEGASKGCAEAHRANEYSAYLSTVGSANFASVILVELGSWIDLGDARGGFFRVPEHFWDLLETSMIQFIERGIDKALIIEDISGSPIVTAASSVRSIFMSTLETRAKDREFEAEYKKELGVFD